MSKSSELLSLITDAQEQAERADAERAGHVANRDALILQALDTDLPRPEIAAAARVNLSRLFKIARREGRRR